MKLWHFEIKLVFLRQIFKTVTVWIVWKLSCKFNAKVINCLFLVSVKFDSSFYFFLCLGRYTDRSTSSVAWWSTDLHISIMFIVYSTLQFVILYRKYENYTLKVLFFKSIHFMQEFECWCFLLTKLWLKIGYCLLSFC